MGKRSYSRGYRPRPQVPINDHALDRFREYWPGSAYLYNSEIQLLLSDQIVDALDRDDFVVAPGGVYVPISIMSEEGYAILVDQRVRTVMPLRFCQEVDQVRKTKR
jgi:hypothetical protein